MLLKSILRSVSAHTVRRSARLLFSKTGKWEKLDKEKKLEIEDHWKDKIRALDEEMKNSKLGDREKHYVVSMFPYPSGKLHMGHIRVYTISDVMARYFTLQGKSVIHPMGWDGFGLPAENAAIERGIQPENWTYSNIRHMKQQLKEMCYSFDWDREVTTCSPTYYRWTQYIFLLMYKAGLAYQKDAEVNWDPVDETVLAEEQINGDGKSWRSGAKVEKKMLRQWYIKTTKYHKSLLEGLDTLDPLHWKDVIAMQREWLGPHGEYRISVPLKDKEGNPAPEGLTGHIEDTVDFESLRWIVLSPNHLLNTPNNVKEANGVLTTLNLTTLHKNRWDEEVPIYVVDDIELFRNGEELHLGIGCLPFCHEDFNKTRLLPGKDDSLPCTSKKLNTSDMSHDVECYPCSKNLRDWLISRQRYWGTPIPIIHCKTCKVVPVPFEDLPVELPKVMSHGRGQSALKLANDWIHTTCPKCGGSAERETDTMDTFLDSSWYFLRYLDATNTSEPFAKNVAKQGMPVDLYIGGKEHAVLHLYYARFFNHFLHDMGLVGCREPFTKLLTQGMIQGRTYQCPTTGRYLKPDEIEFKGKDAYVIGGDRPLVVGWDKMSKSKYNGVDPQDVLSEYGVDTTRLCILSNVSPKSDRQWTDEQFKGVNNWQKKMWNLVATYVENRANAIDPMPAKETEEFKKAEKIMNETRNKLLGDITFHFHHTFLLSSAISRMHQWTGLLKKQKPEVATYSSEYERMLSELVVMVAPMAPMFASELWEGMKSANHISNCQDWESPVLSQNWPKIDETANGHLYISVLRNEVDTIPIPMYKMEAMTNKEIQELAFQSKRLRKVLDNNNISWNKSDQEYTIAQDLDNSKKLTISVERIPGCSTRGSTRGLHVATSKGHRISASNHKLYLAFAKRSPLLCQTNLAGTRPKSNLNRRFATKTIDEDEPYRNVAQIGERTWKIDEIDVLGERPILYAIKGHDKTILVDTGLATGDYKAFLRSQPELSDLPYTIINTHAHCDHISSNFRFSPPEGPVSDVNDLCMGSADKDFSLGHQDAVLDPSLGYLMNAVPKPFKITKWLAEGDMVYLNDAEPNPHEALHVVNLPGHTPDSIGLYMPCGKRIFVGDLIYRNAAILLFLRGTDFQVWRSSVHKLKTFVEERDGLENTTLSCAHIDPNLPATELNELVQFCDDIDLGKNLPHEVTRKYLVNKDLGYIKDEWGVVEWKSSSGNYEVLATRDFSVIDY
ncbi:unnamed protein product [Owenia fusiformis]|uniref:leucine--tRNA ligase n=1 Tax=Owenia fusiformis TaxID=6347 RepID=A0A8S4NQT3_OWEFU|nr:unnamed protein product [Owenia fusiformis]